MKTEQDLCPSSVSMCSLYAQYECLLFFFPMQDLNLLDKLMRLRTKIFQDKCLLVIIFNEEWFPNFSPQAKIQNEEINLFYWV